MIKNLVFLLFTTALVFTFTVTPVYAAEPPGTELNFSSPDPVVSITAYFDVLTEDVESISVVFDDVITSYAYANYIKEDHQLRISIASLHPIELSRAVGIATATLTDFTVAAPEIKLTYLKYNGVKAESNVVPLCVGGNLRDGVLTAQISLRDDLSGTSTVCVSAYDESGKMLAVKVQTFTVEQQSRSFDVDMGHCPDAASIKVFFLSSSWQPYTKAIEGVVTE